MRKITCDWCGLESNDFYGYETEYEWYTQSDTIDLCEECHELYDQINNEMRIFRGKLLEDVDKKIKKETQKRVAKAKNRKVIK